MSISVMKFCYVYVTSFSRKKQINRNTSTYNVFFKENVSAVNDNTCGVCSLVGDLK